MIMRDYKLSDARVADRTARRNFEIDAAQRGKATANGFAQIPGLRIVSGQTYFQQLASLLLHGAPVAGSANAEPALGVFRKFTDGDAGHLSMIALMAMIAMGVAGIDIRSE
jgi:hypothetical protein